MIINNINDHHIIGLKFNDNIVSDKCVIGSFVKNSGELTILNSNHVYDNLKGQFVHIKNFGNWYISDIKTDEDALISTLSLFDCGQKFDVDYEDSYPFPSTMGDWAIWIGIKVGIPLKGSFLNNDLVLNERPYLGNNPTFRDAIKKIAKYACSWIRINYDNTFSIKWFDNSIYEIEDWEDFVHGKSTPNTNVVVLSSGVTNDNVKWPQTEPINPHELRIDDEWTNVNRYAINEKIYNQVNGFSYTSISKLNVPFGMFIRAGSKIKTKDMEFNNVETYISKVSLEWQGGDFDDFESWTTSILMEELNETSTKLKYANSVINRVLNVERKANKNEGLIEDIIEETTEYSKQIIQNTMDINGIKQTMSGTYDFSREVNASNKLIIEKAQSGNIIELRITGEMKLIVPSSSLKPSPNLKPISPYVIIETSSGEKRRVRLPIWRLDKVGNVSDELVVERIYSESTKKYESRAKVIRRIIVNEDGTKIIASSETTENLGILNVPLFKGTNKIYLEDFNDMSYSCKYAIINEVTENTEENYALKTEVKTAIEQTQQSIVSTVNEKLENYSNTREMNSAIEQKANSITESVNAKLENVNGDIQEINGELSLKINENDLCSTLNGKADEINFIGNRFSWSSTGSSMTKDGHFKTEDGEIGGFTINKTNLLCNIVPENDYTQSDIDRLQKILAGSITATTDDLNKFDFNKDGSLNSADLLRCRLILLCGITKSRPGKLVLDTKDWFAPIKILDYSGKVLSSFGPTGSYTYFNED